MTNLGRHSRNFLALYRRYGSIDIVQQYPGTPLDIRRSANQYSTTIYIGQGSYYNVASALLCVFTIGQKNINASYDIGRLLKGLQKRATPRLTSAYAQDNQGCLGV